MLATLLLGVCLIGGGAMMLGLHRALAAPRLTGGIDPADVGVRAIGVRLVTERGRRLFAWYCPPLRTDDAFTPAPAPGLAAIHGWGGNADGLLPLARQLQRHGHGVLLVEARCHGRSEDDTFASMPRFAEDLSAGVDWLQARSEIDARRVAVMGHSVGAGAALLTGSQRRDLSAVISLAAFAHPEDVMRTLLRRLRVPYRPLGWLVNRYVERVIGHRFQDIAPLTTVTRQTAPVLLMHGDADRVVPISDLHRLHSAARAAGRAVDVAILPDVDHEGTDTTTGMRVLDRGAARVRAFLAGSGAIEVPLVGAGAAVLTSHRVDRNENPGTARGSSHCADSVRQHGGGALVGGATKGRPGPAMTG